MKVFSRIHILNKYNTSFFSRILVTNAHEKQVSNPNATRIVMHQAHGLWGDTSLKRMQILLILNLLTKNLTGLSKYVYNNDLQSKAIVKFMLRLEHGNFTLKCLIPIRIKKISRAQTWPSYFARKMEMWKAKCRIFLKDRAWGRQLTLMHILEGWPEMELGTSPQQLDWIT